MAQDEARVSWKKFFVVFAGRTNGAHQPIVNWFKRVGQTEVTSQGESDYVLLFCPIASVVGTDIEEALSNVHAGKPAALMVMHHTFDPDHVVIDSKRLVDDTKVPLTADFLFYEGKLLESDHNRRAFNDIQKFFGVTSSRISASNIQRPGSSLPWRKIFDSFFITTNEPHQTEVKSQDDYVLLSCPIERDIEEALHNVHADKPAALMVMHQTFDPDHVVIDSERLVDNMKIPLTADFLFYEGKLLKSDRNRRAFNDIQKFFGVAPSQAAASWFQKIKSSQNCPEVTFSQASASTFQNVQSTDSSLSWKKFFVLLAGETNGAHQPIVDWFKSVGQTEMTSQEESDYVLLFCPTDIKETLVNVDETQETAGGPRGEIHCI